MFWVACARNIKKTREKKIRVAKFDNSDNGASVLIGLFENISITNGFLDFRASNFLVFTSQNTPKTALPPRRAFQYSLMIQSSVAKGNRILSPLFPRSDCKCGRSFFVSKRVEIQHFLSPWAANRKASLSFFVGKSPGILNR